jgi:hypothetical protein
MVKITGGCSVAGLHPLDFLVGRGAFVKRRRLIDLRRTQSLDFLCELS